MSKSNLPKRPSAAPGKSAARRESKPPRRDSRIPLAKRDSKAPSVKGKRIRRKPEEAREHILSAATTMMGTYGPDGVGLESIAKSAGVSHALITHYFGTYSALTREVMKRQNERIRARLLTAMFGKPPTDIDAWIHAYADAVSDPLSARMMAWSALFGSDEQRSLVDQEFLKAITNTLYDNSAQVGANYAGKETEARERIMRAVIFSISATLGLSLAAPVLAAGVGLADSAEATARVRAYIARIALMEMQWPIPQHLISP